MAIELGTNINIVQEQGEKIDPTIFPGLWRNGVSFRFHSGYMLSIQCGSMNYCTKTKMPGGAEDAEIAVHAPDGSWATRAVVAGALGEDIEDEVRGHTTVSEIAKIMAHLDNWVGE